MNKIIYSSILCALIVFAVTSAAPTQAATVGSRPLAGQNLNMPNRYDSNVLFIASVQDPTTMDPAFATSYSEGYTHNMYDRLVRVDRATGNIVPDVADSWDMSPDGLTYTLHLHKGIKFHDGTNLDAEAVKYNFERLTALQAWLAGAWQYIAGMKVVDTNTLQVTLKEPVALWIDFLVTNPKIVSPSCVKAHEVQGDLGKAWLAEHECGSGPYVLKSWTKGRELVFTKFDGYWRGWDGKHVSEVHQLIVPEPATQRLMLEKGELDVALLYRDEYIPAYQKNPDLQLFKESPPYQMYVRLNPNGGPTKDKNVRLALAHLFDYQTFLDLVGVPNPRSDGPVPMNLFLGSRKAPEIPYNTFSLDKAKEYLAKSAYPQGFKMTIIADPEEPRQRASATLLQANAAKLNIKIDVITEPWVQTIARGDKKEVQYDSNNPQFTNAFMLTTLAYYPDPSAFLERMYLPKSYGGVRNFFWYENPEVIDLIQRGMKMADRPKAMDLYWQANLKIIDDVPDIFLDKWDAWNPARKWVHGFVPHALTQWLWYYYDTWKD